MTRAAKLEPTAWPASVGGAIETEHETGFIIGRDTDAGNHLNASQAAVCQRTISKTKRMGSFGRIKINKERTAMRLLPIRRDFL